LGEVVQFPNAEQRAAVAAARRIETAAQARHDWVAEHREAFVRLARDAAAAARTTPHVLR
jgi:hypothetical protein